MLHKCLLYLAIILTGTSLYGQRPVIEGTYTFETVAKNKRSRYLEKTLTCRFKNMGLNDSGYTRMQTTIIGFGSSDEVNITLDGTDQLIELMLLNQPFEFLLNPDGYITDQTGTASILNEKVISWALKPEIKTSILQYGYYVMLQTGRELFNCLSATVANGNNTWWNRDSSILYTVTRVMNDSTVFTRNREWCDVLVKMTSWSTALRMGLQYDSAKVFTFFQKYDDIYGNDRNYRLKKLSILQSLSTANGYEMYQKELSSIPNAWIKNDDSHILNKLSREISRNTDSIYLLLRFLSKTPSFHSWVQQDFAQVFIHTDTTDKNIRKEMLREGYPVEDINAAILETQQRFKNGNIILNKLVNETDTVLRNAAYPLYLWSQTRQNMDDTLLQRNTVQKLRQLSPSQATQGNAHRYSLLMYKQLKPHQAALANDLLTYTIHNLEKETNDTTAASRYTARNMLAYAWQLKYEDARQQNLKNALQYLSKASEYSPRSKKESVHASFYDRSFLDSKESYRPEFAAVLLSAGDQKEAIKVLAEQVQADPSMLTDLKKSFEASFPEKNFNIFINDVVIRSWGMAPDFSLKGINGELFQLSDYKGKWLLIDFWGTWCGPCVEEMPEINEFVKHLSEKSSLAFLSIACYDNQEQVKRFLKDQAFNLPTAMSDNIVEKRFQVTGYPSKFMISPDGRMLPLQSRSDWKKIMNQFSQLSQTTIPPPAQSKPINKVMN